MATTQRRIEANRANALKSTGPRSARGKRAASRNAIAHGLTSRASLLPGDDPREYRRFAMAILDELDPRGPLQEELAGEIANLSWKLRRAPGAESILMEEKHLVEGAEAPPMRAVVNMILDKSQWDHTPRSPLWLLDRYTRNLERSRAAAVRMLLSLQKRQRREPEDDDPSADAPAAHAPAAHAPAAHAPAAHAPVAYAPVAHAGGHWRLAGGGAAVEDTVDDTIAPVQSEPNAPAGGDAAQAEAPPSDAAAGSRPCAAVGAQGEANSEATP